MRDFPKTLRYFLCGLAMGAADVVPGVSGGTIAYMSGIYETLLDSIRSFDAVFLRLILQRRWKAALQHVRWSFLLPLACGVLLSIFSLARLILWLLGEWPDILWGFFSGLILASIALMARKLPPRLLPMLFLLAGAAAAWHVAGMGSLQAGHGPANIFAAGFIALCAMILPGISGSFMLVLMGQYACILQAVTELRLSVLLVFACGGACGLLLFSRLLSRCFSRFPRHTHAVMIGIMAGCLRLAWPWQADGLPVLPHNAGARELAAVLACAAGMALLAVFRSQMQRQRSNNATE